jgi:uncharacterized membrane protein YbhN (UPF0104 family)
MRIADSAVRESGSRAEEPSAGRKPGQSTIRNLQSAIGYLLALAGLIWALGGLELPKLLGQVARINWRLIALAVLCDVLSYLTQGKRWSLLLKPGCCAKQAQSALRSLCQPNAVNVFEVALGAHNIYIDSALERRPGCIPERAAG